MTIKVEEISQSSSQISNDCNPRQVAGCLPIDSKTKRVLLVTSRKHEGVWVIPKGGLEEGETLEETAKRETFEEAGVKGKISGFLGMFPDVTRKGKIKSELYIYELVVNDEDVDLSKKWKERKKRERKWFSYKKAHEKLSERPFMQKALEMSSLAPAANNGAVSLP